VRLAYLSTLYPVYAAAFATARSGVERSAAAWRAELQEDAFGWAGAWGPALAPLGCTVEEVWLNLEPLLRAWAREDGALSPDSPLDDIAVAQVERFQPDILWYDHHDTALLERIRGRCPSLRACVGWTGSVVPDTPLWRRFSLVLSCAPEAVGVLERRGVRAALLTHAFNERVLDRLGPRQPTLDVSFVGQLAADHPLHAHRERLLDALLAEVPVAVFSPSVGIGPRSRGRALPRQLLYAGAVALRRSGVPEESLRRLPLLGRAAGWPCAPRGPLPGRLRRALRPARFGLAMYRTLRDSRITLNVHAAHATGATSNMRLFEATGAGACLLTDAAENLSELFEPGQEVATFRDTRECRDRIHALLADEAAREVIARAGQARCLAGHTFRHRAPVLLERLRETLR